MCSNSNYIEKIHDGLVMVGDQIEFVKRTDISQLTVPENSLDILHSFFPSNIGSPVENNVQFHLRDLAA